MERRLWKGFLGFEGILDAGPYANSPKAWRGLYMYLLVSKHAVSVVSLRDQGVQQPIYHISKTLVNAEMRYLPLEKLVLALLVHAMRKLPHYFQAHTIYVLTKYPLQSLLKRFDFTRRIAKWGTQLGSFDIKYKPRSSVKGQVLTDFVAEGASSALRARARIVVITPEGIWLENSFRLSFKASNNEAEYGALLSRLRVVSDICAKEVEIYSDSRLVVNQV